MDNSGIVHQTKIPSYAISIQTYVETGRVVLDLNGLHRITDPIRMNDEETERLIGILEAALADRAR